MTPSIKLSIIDSRPLYFSSHRMPHVCLAGSTYSGQRSVRNVTDVSPHHAHTHIRLSSWTVSGTVFRLGITSSQWASREVSIGFKKPKSLHFLTLYEHGIDMSGLKPARIFASASSSSPHSEN